MVAIFKWPLTHRSFISATPHFAGDVIILYGKRCVLRISSDWKKYCSVRPKYWQIADWYSCQGERELVAFPVEMYSQPIRLNSIFFVFEMSDTRPLSTKLTLWQSYHASISQILRPNWKYAFLSVGGNSQNANITMHIKSRHSIQPVRYFLLWHVLSGTCLMIEEKTLCLYPRRE